MPDRLEKVINGMTSEIAGVVSIPEGTRAIQLVLDRRPFENVIVGVVCSVDLYNDSNDEYLGGVTWGGGRLDGLRPGQRMLWSYGVWSVNGVTRVRYVLKSPRAFQCRLDIDVFE